MRYVLALVLATLVVPVAFAQVPAPPRCSTLALSPVDPGELSPAEAREVSFTVANTGTQSEVMARVTAAFAADASGWSVTPAEVAGIRLGPGGSATVTFTVTAPDERGAAAPLNAVAGGECSANGQTLPLPGIAVVDDVPASMSISTAEARGFAFDLSALQNVPPLVFVGALAGLVIVGGAIAASRTRGAGFTAACPEPEKALRAGRGASFPLEIKNRGKERDTARFEVGPVPQGWSAFMALPELMLAGGESRTIWLMVRAPPDAAAGSHAVLSVTVRSKEHPRFESKVSIKAAVGAEDATVGDAEATRMQ